MLNMICCAAQDLLCCVRKKAIVFSFTARNLIGFESVGVTCLKGNDMIPDSVNETSKGDANDRM